MSARPFALHRAAAAVLTILVLGLLTAPSAVGATPSAHRAAGHAHKAAKPTTGSRNDTFGIGPGTARGLDRTRSALNYQMDPNASLSDHVAVVNVGSKPLRISVYAADGATTSTGAVSYDPRADAGSGARTWIAFGKARRSSLQLLVKPRSVSAVPIVISPPSNATPGDHLVGIFASITSRATIGGSNGGKPNVEQRVALRTFIRISGPLRSALTVSDLGANYHSRINPFATGSVTVSYTVTNAGNVSLGAAQVLSVTGLFGSTGSVPKLAAIPVLLPGSTYPVKVEVPGVRPEAFMHAKVTLTPEGVTGSVDPREAAFSSSASFWALPWLLLAALLVLIVLVVLTYRWRRAHPSSARHQRTSTRIPVATGKA